MWQISASRHCAWITVTTGGTVLRVARGCSIDKSAAWHVTLVSSDEKQKSSAIDIHCVQQRVTWEEKKKQYFKQWQSVLGNLYRHPTSLHYSFYLLPPIKWRRLSAIPFNVAVTNCKVREVSNSVLQPDIASSNQHVILLCCANGENRMASSAVCRVFSWTTCNAMRLPHQLTMSCRGLNRDSASYDDCEQNVHCESGAVWWVWWSLCSKYTPCS